MRRRERNATTIKAAVLFKTLAARLYPERDFRFEGFTVQKGCDLTIASRMQANRGSSQGRTRGTKALRSGKPGFLADISHAATRVLYREIFKVCGKKIFGVIEMTTCPADIEISWKCRRLE